MALTPMDIHHKEFKTARFGGYNEEDVDSFLDLVADEFERSVQENSDLRQQMEHLKKRLSEFEEMQTSLQSALLAASKSAEAVKEQARQESESLVSKAQEESDSLVRSAQEQARQMLLAAQNDRQKMERAIAKLQEVKKRYLESIKQLADAHLLQVADWESRNEAEGIVVETPVIEVPPPPPVVVMEQPPEAPVQAPPQPEARPAPPPVVDSPPRPEADAPPPPAEPPAPPTARAATEPPVAREMREVAPERAGAADVRTGMPHLPARTSLTRFWRSTRATSPSSEIWMTKKAAKGVTGAARGERKSGTSTSSGSERPARRETGPRRCQGAHRAPSTCRMTNGCASG
jgi:cell division initiation protein